MNPRCFRKSDFESDTIGHSDTPPELLIARSATELREELSKDRRALGASYSTEYLDSMIESGIGRDLVQ